MSKIRDARRVISEVADTLEGQGGNLELAANLRLAVEMMYRRPPARRAPRHSERLTPARKAAIIKLAETTELHSSEIAAQVGVNPGRVSEILQGDR